MTPRRVRVGLFSFLGLGIGLTVNMLLLQPKSGRQVTARAGQEITLWQGLERSEAASERGAGSLAQNLDPSAVTTGTLSPADMALDPTAREQKVAGDVIRGVQRELKTRGYDPGAADGVPGLVTRAAIMAYEFDHGLALTADATEELLKQIVLGSATVGSSAPVSAQPGRHAEVVIRSVQQNLKALGYDPGGADGALREATVRAIRDFEADQKLAETGRISSALVQRLVRLSGQSRVAQQP